MPLKKLLEKNKTALQKKWFDSVAKTYPLDTSRFLKKNKDFFANPVGGNLSKGLVAILDELIKGPDRERVITYLDPIIRVRAIQDFSPSQAVAFVASLKDIVREALKKDLRRDDKIGSQLMQFERTVDELQLLAFDIYVGCRERIYDLKANEEKNKVFKAFKRAGLITDISDEEQNPVDSEV